MIEEEVDLTQQEGGSESEFDNEVSEENDRVELLNDGCDELLGASACEQRSSRRCSSITRL